MPVPLAALISATGQFSSAESFEISTLPPRCAKSSAMFNRSKRRQPQAENWRGQHQIAPKIGGIEDQYDGVGLGEVLTFAFQDVVGDLFVFGTRVQAINARQVDKKYFLPLALQLGFPHPVLHRDAGEVRHLLAQAGQAIEKSRLAGIRRSDNRNDDRTAVSGAR